MKTLIVNKVLPEHADGAFLEKRRKQEKNYLDEIDYEFKRQQTIKVPLFEEDVSDMDKLSIFADHLSTLLKEDAAK